MSVGFTDASQPGSPLPAQLTAGNPRWAGTGSPMWGGETGVGWGGLAQEARARAAEGGDGRAVLGRGGVNRLGSGQSPSQPGTGPGESSPRRSRAWRPALSLFCSFLGWTAPGISRESVRSQLLGVRRPRPPLPAPGRSGSEGRAGRPLSRAAFSQLAQFWEPSGRPALPLSPGKAGSLASGLLSLWPPGGGRAWQGSAKARSAR